MGLRESAVGDMELTPGFWAGRRVLVTGNTGFKGSWLSLWLLDLGAEVHGLSLPAATDPSLYGLAGLAADVEQHTVDVRDTAAVHDAVAAVAPQVVIHMAAQPFVRRSFDDPVETYGTNVMGTVNVLDAVRRSPTAEVVLNVTSDKCYENREWVWGYREDEPMGGFDPYSNSKGCSELVTGAFRTSYFGESTGPALASGRAGNVIGGGDWGEDRLIPDVVRAVLAGETVAIRRPDAIRPWQHVLNPLSGYLLLCERLAGDRSLARGFNFGPPDTDARPVAEIVDKLARAWPGSVDVEIDPGPHPHEATWLKLDSSLAAAELGWRPRWLVDEAIEAIVEWHTRVRDGESARSVSVEQLNRFRTGG